MEVGREGNRDGLSFWDWLGREIRLVEEECKECQLRDGVMAASDALVTLDGLYQRAEWVRRNLTSHVSTTRRVQDPYEVGKAQTKLKEMEQAIRRFRDQCIPRTPFTFSSKEAYLESVRQQLGQQCSAEPRNCEKAAAEGMLTRSASTSKYSSLSQRRNVEGRSGERISGWCERESVMLRKLRDCYIELTGVITAARIQDVRNSTLLISTVQSSVRIDGCDGCTFFLAARQLRIHHCQDSEFRVHVSSGPILESSHGLRFGPWTEFPVLAHPKLPEQERKAESAIHSSPSPVEEAGLDLSVNVWDDVRDFNWFKTEPSPHWTKIETEVT
uniref:C-CAP/cofactor C-like domain-containing protein n=1 Tax=Compsopogon caeruleus TaxID=31354 RepID=A0A7S1T908_9RHOD|mmetsp:Transcript_13348/g.27112  ORF Transcript_13348/g.27112 Transcript_13348/m.27112 type:complete len:329 (+) Transcript_13348:29-1015(+)